METKNDFKERIRTPKNPIGILVVDDNGEGIKEQIKEQIECKVSGSTVDYLTRMINNKNEGNYLDRYKAIFVDATYKDEKSGESAVEVLEELIKTKPEYAEICKVLIGTDIIEYAKADDFEARYLIDRVRRLPHIIYGGENGSKTENMIKHIQKEGIKRGFEVITRLPQGKCNKKLLEAIKPYFNRISSNLNEQKNISIELMRVLREFEPENEQERRIISSATEVANLFMYNQHSIMNAAVILNGDCYIANKNLEDNDSHDAK